MKRPESPEEWREQRITVLQRLVLPAAAAVVTLLEAGEDADVKAVGKPLDERQRWGVLTELGQLADAARRDYPPAARLVVALREAWARRWGDREPLPKRPQVVAREKRERPLSMAEDPPDAARVGESWATYGAAWAARLAAGRPQDAGA